MKRIIATLTIFFLSLFVLDRLFSYTFSRYIFSNTLSGESGGSLNYLIKHKRNSDFIIMGSSRAKHHLDPALFTNAFAGNGYNAGINGVGMMIYNQILLDILVNNKVVPKTLFLQTDAYLFEEREGESVAQELIPLYPFINQSTQISAYIDYTERAKLLLHSYRYNGKFLNIVFNYLKRDKVQDNNGFVGLAGTLKSAKAAGESSSARKTPRLSDAKMDALTKAMENCRKHNIELVVLLLPFYNNEGLNMELHQRFVATLRSKGLNKIIDLSNINKLPQLNSPAFWRDGAHLNATGAAILSKEINNRLPEYQ